MNRPYEDADGNPVHLTISPGDWFELHLASEPGRVWSFGRYMIMSTSAGAPIPCAPANICPMLEMWDPGRPKVRKYGWLDAHLDSCVIVPAIPLTPDHAPYMTTMLTCEDADIRKLAMATLAMLEAR